MNNIIAAVRNDSEFLSAVNSNVKIIFDLNPDLLSLNKKLECAHKAGKKVFIHIDLATGIGKDKSGIIFSKNAGVDGIISTRVNIIKLAREQELLTVQRFFMVDSHSVDTAIEAIKASKPDMVEIMPGLMTKAIQKLKQSLSIPIIAGGLIATREEADNAFEAGAFAISTGTQDMW